MSRFSYWTGYRDTQLSCPCPQRPRSIHCRAVRYAAAPLRPICVACPTQGTDYSAPQRSNTTLRPSWAIRMSQGLTLAPAECQCHKREPQREHGQLSKLRTSSQGFPALCDCLAICMMRGFLLRLQLTLPASDERRTQLSLS
jgi:hypothetical protein